MVGRGTSEAPRPGLRTGGHHRLALWLPPQGIAGAFSSPRKSRSRFFSWPLRAPQSAAFSGLCRCRLATIPLFPPVQPRRHIEKRTHDVPELLPINP
jgi:hypothetical protein